MIRPAPSWITSRLDLAELCNRTGLTSLAVEVGVHQGHFASNFLQEWRGGTLYCVDPYYHGTESDGQDFGTKAQRDEDYHEACEAVRKAQRKGQHFDFLRIPSQEAALRFRPNTVDFVYLDACHSYEQILADLIAWWDRVAPGGILAGHDVVCFGERDPARNWGLNVQAALSQWLAYLAENHLPQPDIQVIIEQRDLTPFGACWSYYMEKP